MGITQGINRKNQKFQDVKTKQKGYQDIERRNRESTYDNSSVALNEALNKFDKDSETFAAPNASYTPDEFAMPTRTNSVVTNAETSANDAANFELGQFGTALANMDNANGLIASLAPALMKAQQEGNYGQQSTRAGANTLDYQLRNLKGQEYDRMGDLLSQLGGAGLTYGLNQNAIG